MKRSAASICAALLVAACAQDAPGVETHLIDDPAAGSVKVAVWPRGGGLYDVVVFDPAIVSFPSPNLLDTRANRAEVARNVLSDGRCGTKKPVPVDTHLQNNIQMMRFECR